MSNESLVKYREQAISVIKSYFPKVQEALFYLEAKECEFSLAAYIDIRDVLSHLCTILREDIDAAAARDNVSNLCEHLRRAIAEPYQIAFERRLAKINERYHIYNRKLAKWERILFLRGHHHSTREIVRTGIVNARNLWIRGRRKKGSNMWNAEFEEAIEHFIEAYDILSDLEPKIQEMYNRLHERKFFLYLSLGTVILGTIISAAVIIFRS